MFHGFKKFWTIGVHIGPMDPKLGLEGYFPNFLIGWAIWPKGLQSTILAYGQR